MKKFNDAPVYLFYVGCIVNLLNILFKTMDLNVPMFNKLPKEEISSLLLFLLFLIYSTFNIYKHIYVVGQNKPDGNFWAFVTNRIKKFTGIDISSQTINIAVIYEKTDQIEPFFKNLSIEEKKSGRVEFYYFSCSIKDNLDYKEQKSRMRNILNQCQAVVIINSIKLATSYQWTYNEVSDWGNTYSQMPCLIIDKIDTAELENQIPEGMNLSIQYSKTKWEDIIDDKKINLPNLIGLLLSKTLQRSELWRIQASVNRKYAFYFVALAFIAMVFIHYKNRERESRLEDTIVKNNRRLVSCIMETHKTDSLLFKNTKTFNYLLQNYMEYYNVYLCNEKPGISRKLTLWVIDTTDNSDTIARQIAWSYSKNDKETKFNNRKNLITCAINSTNCFTSYDKIKKIKKWNADDSRIIDTDECYFDTNQNRSIPNKILCYSQKIDNIKFSVSISTTERQTAIDSVITCRFLKNISYQIMEAHSEAQNN